MIKAGVVCACHKVDVAECESQGSELSAEPKFRELNVVQVSHWPHKRITRGPTYPNSMTPALSQTRHITGEPTATGPIQDRQWIERQNDCEEEP